MSKKSAKSSSCGTAFASCSGKDDRPRPCADRSKKRWQSVSKPPDQLRLRGAAEKALALQESFGQLREHSPPARLDNHGVDTCLLEGHLRADFALLEFKL